MNMEAKPQLEQSMQEEQIRTALNAHWHASAVGDLNAEHDIYDDDAICDYPQSGERILGRSNLQALRSHHPGKPSVRKCAQARRQCAATCAEVAQAGPIRQAAA
jgi:hypothetical protein